MEAARYTMQSEESPDKHLAQKVMAVAEHNLEAVSEAEGSTYSGFMASETTGVSDVLVERFAKLLALAGDNCTVVLTSKSWNRPENLAFVKSLEHRIGRYLGVPFAFDTATFRTRGNSAKNQLDTIGAFIERYIQSSSPSAEQQIIVLDDLYCTAMPDVDASFQSVADAGNYLRRWSSADSRRNGTLRRAHVGPHFPMSFRRLTSSSRVRQCWVVEDVRLPIFLKPKGLI